MTLWSTLTDWGKWIWDKPLTSSLVNGAYQTVSYLFEQVGVIPKTVYSVFTHGPTRGAIGHILYIALEDVTPLVFALYGNQLIQNYGKEALKDESRNDWLAIQMFLYLLQTSVWVFSLRKALKITVRTTVLSIEAPICFNQIQNDSRQMSHCVIARCTASRFMHSGLREGVVVYFGTEAFIFLVRQIPVVGPWIAPVMRVQHDGRYILTTVIPNLCGRHQRAYLYRYQALAWSLGLSHVMSSQVVTELIHWTTACLFSWYMGANVLGIPPAYYKDVVAQFMLIVQMMLAAHMQLPALDHDEIDAGMPRWFIPNPVDLAQSAIGYTFDTFLKGLKARAEHQRKAPPDLVAGLVKNGRALPWREIDLVWKHRVVQFFASLFLPRMLQNEIRFIHDPVIHPNWEILAKILIQSLILTRQYTPYVGVLPTGVTTMAVHRMTGVPRPTTAFLLAFFSNRDILFYLYLMQRRLERLLENDGQQRIMPLFSITRSPPLNGQVLAHQPAQNPLVADEPQVHRAAPEVVQVIRRTVRPFPITSSQGGMVYDDEKPSQAIPTAQVIRRTAPSLSFDEAGQAVSHNALPSMARVIRRVGVFSPSKGQQIGATIDKQPVSPHF